MRAPRERRAGRAAGALAVLATTAVVGGCGSGTHNTTRAAAVGTAAQTSPARQLQQSFTGIVKAVAPEVVQIQTDSGLGSGIVLDGRGDIVTNAHVVTGARSIAVTLASEGQHPAA